MLRDRYLRFTIAFSQQDTKLRAECFVEMRPLGDHSSQCFVNIVWEIDQIFIRLLHESP